MEISKAFDTLNYNLLIGKLGAYGFRKDALTYMETSIQPEQLCWW